MVCDILVSQISFLKIVYCFDVNTSYNSCNDIDYLCFNLKVLKYHDYVITSDIQ